MPATTPAAARPRRRARSARRWPGLDVARGTLVLFAAVLGVAAWLAPAHFGPTPWVGVTLIDLVPGAFLVLAGVAAGWRAEAGGQWSPRRRRRRATLLVAAGVLVVAARTAGDPSLLGPDELLWLAGATGVAAWLAARPRLVPFVATPLLLLAGTALTTGNPWSRGLGTLDPGAAWRLEHVLGVPAGGVPLASVPPAVALVLVGHAVGAWMHRRPAGPASGAALLTVALWSGIGVFVAAAVIAPVPRILSLPVALAAIAVALAVLGAGHLAVALARSGGPPPTAQAAGRVALVPMTIGAAVLGLLPADSGLVLSPVAAVTAGAVVAMGVARAAVVLSRRGPLRA